ncbi:MAG: RNA polymerase sigma factor [Inquilinaceae bacterium]
MEALASRLQAACPVALATLIRLLGDIDAAEDALQEATARALATWPHRGMPENPSAWLIATARNHTVDLHRRRAMEARHLRALAPLEMPSAPPPDIDTEGGALQDDLLRLIFTCCHPALSVEAQIALTLKTVAGLSVDDIARAFLTAPRAMEQRLTRAKRKIRDAGIPYRVPGDQDLAQRLEAVLAVVYLIFNAGYNASAGPDLIRTDLCEQAIRLGRTVGRLFRAEPEVTGLLALMLLQHSRRRARLDGDRRIVPLDRQDRQLWDQPQIDEGRVLVEKALRRGRPGPYQIQAAIAALHCQARRAEDTDWPQIAELYRLLETHQPSPIVVLNRGVAVGRAEGPRAGLALLARIAPLPEIQRYHHFHAAQGAMLAEDGQRDAAVAAFSRALALTDSPVERGYLRQRMDTV